MVSHFHSTSVFCRFGTVIFLRYCCVRLFSMPRHSSLSFLFRSRNVFLANNEREQRTNDHVGKYLQFFFHLVKTYTNAHAYEPIWVDWTCCPIKCRHVLFFFSGLANNQLVINSGIFFAAVAVCRCPIGLITNAKECILFGSKVGNRHKISIERTNDEVRRREGNGRRVK